MADAEAAEEAETAATLDARPVAKVRLYYAIVIIHHCLSGFAGGGALGLAIGGYRSSYAVFGIAMSTLDQAYFMPTFFFISAYFTPSSCDRKGVRTFLLGKLQRLYPPLFLYVLALGPLMHFLVDLTLTKMQYAYFPDPGPTWFLAWLLLFNFAYCTIDCTDTIVATAPSFRAMCGIGAAAGL